MSKVQLFVTTTRFRVEASAGNKGPLSYYTESRKRIKRPLKRPRKGETVDDEIKGQRRRRCQK